MTWNHRIMRDAKSGDFIITECYYDKDGNIEGWTDTDGRGHAPWGTDLEDIYWSLESMSRARSLPVLDEAELLRDMGMEE